MKNPPTIYMITNTKSGSIYIGQTVESTQKRLGRHIRAAFILNENTKLYAAMKSYGKNVFHLSIIEILNDRSELDEAEIFWIAYFKLIGANLYNMTPGGSQWAHTKETKSKIAAGNRGKITSEETKAKISLAKKGIKMSDEARANMSKAGKGRPKTEEFKLMISKVHKGKKVLEETLEKMSIAASKQERELHTLDTKQKMSQSAGSRKLSDKDYQDIQNFLSETTIKNPIKFLAEKYNVNKATIHRIKNNKHKRGK